VPAAGTRASSLSWLSCLRWELSCTTTIYDGW
jgi:hypothetical protein